MAGSDSYCTTCGATLEPGAKFCTSCGEKVATAVRPPSRSAPPKRGAPPPPPKRSAPLGPSTRPKRSAPPPPPLSERPRPPAATRASRAGPLNSKGTNTKHSNRKPKAQGARVSTAVPAAASTSATGGFGSLMNNVIFLSVTWAIAWGVGDFVGYIYAMGLDVGLEGLASSDPDTYSIITIVENAIGGASGGAIAGLLISLVFFGASVGGLLRFLFTLAFWIGADVFVVEMWRELGIDTIDAFLGITSVFAIVYGLVISISLLSQKSGMAILRVPFGAFLLALAAVLGRMIQFEML